MHEELGGATGLWLAVLTRAVYDAAGVNVFARDPNVARQIERGARAWFNAASESVGSFRWVCFMLNVDPGRARRVLLDRAEHYREKFMDTALERNDTDLATLTQVSRKFSELLGAFPAEYGPRQRIMTETRGEHVFIQVISTLRIPSNGNGKQHS